MRAEVSFTEPDFQKGAGLFTGSLAGTSPNGAPLHGEVTIDLAVLAENTPDITPGVDTITPYFGPTILRFCGHDEDPETGSPDRLIELFTTEKLLWDFG